MLEEGKILSYREVLEVGVGENDEALTDVRCYNPSIIARYEKGKEDMLPITGKTIFVRESLAQKLARISLRLEKRNLRLRIAYGYRHPLIQQKYFSLRRAIHAEKYPEKSGTELDELTHGQVAVPTVAGHPTGGAVDVTITENTSERNDLDMGTGIAVYADLAKIKTLADGLTEPQKENRRLLLDLMLDEEFAPFYGEWWHFSYGDREWARFYGKASSLYSHIDFRTEKITG